MAKVNQHTIISEIAAELKEETPNVTRRQVAEFYDTFIDKVVEHLAAGDDVEFTRVALFEHVTTAAKEGRNPQTGEKLSIPAKNKVKIRTRSRLNELTKEA